MCEHLGRCSVPSAYNTSAGSAAHSHHDLNERMRRGRGNWISRPPDLNRGNGKHQSDRNQATGRKLLVSVLYTLPGCRHRIVVFSWNLGPHTRLEMAVPVTDR